MVQILALLNKNNVGLAVELQQSILQPLGELSSVRIQVPEAEVLEVVAVVAVALTEEPVRY